LSETVIHFGPDPAFVGGMGRVIDAYARHGIGGLACAHPTWVPAPRRRTVRLTLGALRRIASADRRTIVHVHLSERGSFVREGAILALAGARRMRTVATLHGGEFMPFAERHPRLVAGVLGRAGAIVCLSAEVEEHVKSLLPRARTFRVPNPVMVDDGSPPADGTSERVLFAGEIGLRKGVDVLLDAWPRVAARRPQARCVLVGPATTLEVPSNDSFQVHGPQSPEAIGCLLRESRMVVLPSRAEAMPMILVEAQGAARPFVATPVGAVPELAQHGGVLVPVEDPARLAEAILDLLDRPRLAADLGEQGRAFVRSTRSVEVVDARIRSVYEGL
jgi:glycosyltransferase involved in cell wall biosynthesis